MTKQELTEIVREAIRDAGYKGVVSTWPRKVNGRDHTDVRDPSDGVFEYLTGYLVDYAEVLRHPITKTVMITWNAPEGA